MVGGDPVLVIGLGAGGDSRGFVVRGGSNGFDLARCLLATSRRLTLLLREVWDNPDGVEEIADTDSACEKEEVEEEAIAGCKRLNQSTGEWETYSCGSKMVASGSTMETVPLKAGRVKKAF